MYDLVDLNEHDTTDLRICAETHLRYIKIKMTEWS